ncbi:uncharacterized protein LOC141855302 isoform X2 [Brevipalpus obovatus]|uniref:uncharacterized protein LOC141855302 isoform X2 n=1 Tax=Brevipalpus obovatus TaxID=246614 RepID=UPI003D9F69AB
MSLSQCIRILVPFIIFWFSIECTTGLVNDERLFLGRLISQHNQQGSGCNYQGKKYSHGDVVITPEPCLNCTCKKGVLLCLLRVCPSLVHQHVGDTCVTSRDPGQCCPTVRCRNKSPITLDALIPENDGNTDGLDISAVTSGPILSNEMDKQGRTEETITLTLPMASQSSNSLSSETSGDLHSAIRKKIAAKVNHNNVMISTRDQETTLLQTNPTTVFHDSPKLVTSSPSSFSPSREESTNFLNKIDRGCYLNGTLYAEGSAVMSTSYCEYCYCIRGKKMCIRPRCHLAILGCMPRYTSEYACCPTSYVCGNSPYPSMELEDRRNFLTTPSLLNMMRVPNTDGNEAFSFLSSNSNPIPMSTSTSTTSTTTPSTTSQSPSSSVSSTLTSSSEILTPQSFARKACRINGILYQLGEQIPSDIVCQNCYCSLGGVKRCKQITCSPIMEGCMPVIPDGHCCPVEYKCLQGHKPRVDTSLERSSPEDANEVTTEISTDLPLRVSTSVTPSMSSDRIEVRTEPSNSSTSYSDSAEVTLDYENNGKEKSIDGNAIYSTTMSSSSLSTKDNFEHSTPINEISHSNDNSLVNRIGQLSDKINTSNTSSHKELKTFSIKPTPFTSSSLTMVSKLNSTTNFTTTKAPVINTNSSSESKVNLDKVPDPPANSPQNLSMGHRPYSRHQSSDRPKDTVEMVLEGIIEALDRRIQTKLPAEPRDPPQASKYEEELKNITAILFPDSSASSPEPMEESEPEPEPAKPYPSVLGLSEEDKEDDENDEESDPMKSILDSLPIMYSGSIDNPHLNFSNSSIPRRIMNQTLPSSLYPSTLNQTEKSILSSTESVTQNIKELSPATTTEAVRKVSPQMSNINQTHNSKTNTSASIMVQGSDTGDSSDQPIRKGSVLDDDGSSVDIITAGTPLMHDIANQDSILVNLSSSSFKVSVTESSSVKSTTVNPSSSTKIFNTTEKPANPVNVQDHKSSNSGPEVGGLIPLHGSGHDWKVMTQNHSPKPYGGYYESNSQLMPTDTKYRSEGSKIEASMRHEPEKKPRIESGDENNYLSSLAAQYRPQPIPLSYHPNHPGAGHALGQKEPFFNYGSTMVSPPPPVNQMFGQPGGGFQPSPLRPNHNSSSFSVRVPNIRKPPHFIPGAIRPNVASLTSCRIGDQEYANGAMIVKADPCTICRCFYGRESCQQQKCSEPRPGCSPRYIEGHCCPHYTCKHTNTIKPASQAGPGIIPNRKPGHFSIQTLKAPPHISQSDGQASHIRPGIESTTPHQSNLRPFPNQPKRNVTIEQSRVPEHHKVPSQPTRVMGNESIHVTQNSQLNNNRTDNSANTTANMDSKNQDRIHFPPPEKAIKPPSSVEKDKNSSPPNQIGANNLMSLNQIPAKKQSLLPHLILPNMMSSNVQHPSSVNGQPQLRPTWPEPKPQKIGQSIGTPPKKLPGQTVTSPTWIDGSLNGNGMPLDIQRVPSTNLNKFPDKPIIPNSITNDSKLDANQGHRINPSIPQDEMMNSGSEKMPSLAVHQTLSAFSTSKPIESTPPRVAASIDNKPSEEESDDFSAPWDKLRVSGCNIYGTFYKVDQFINELSSSCKRCICSTFGVQCTKTC